MRISIPTIAAAAFAFSLGAHADTSADGSFTRGHSAVQYGDINIATEQGAKVMLVRIERAARKACGGHATFSSITGGLDNTFKECCDHAVQRAVEQLGAPMVTRMYSETKSRAS